MESFKHSWLLAAALIASLLGGCVATSPGDDLGASTAGSTLPAVSCPDPCMVPIGAPELSAWEPHVAVDPTDPDHIVVVRNSYATDSVTGTDMIKLFAHVTFDGGDTWQTARLPTGPEAGSDHPLYRMTGGGDQNAAFLPDGTVLFAGLFQTYANGVAASTATGYSTFVARSTDGGLTWPETSIVARGAGALLFPATGRSVAAGWDGHDKPWIATDAGGNVLMVWSRIQSNTAETGPASQRCDLVFSLSTDGGRTWSPHEVIELGGCWSGAAPVSTSDGAWHVAYISFLDGTLKVATSRDMGATWDAQTLGAAAYNPAMTVQVLSNGTERMLLTYPARVGDGEQATVLRWSDDLGATWSDALGIDPVGTPGRTLPAVAADANGTAYVTFFRDEGGSANDATAHHYVVAVRDGVAGEPVLLDGTSTGLSRAVGDYVGLAGLPDGAFSVWSHIEDGGADLVGARIVAMP